MTLDLGRLRRLEQVIARLAHELAEAKRELAALQSQSSTGVSVPAMPAPPLVRAMPVMLATPAAPLAEGQPARSAAHRAVRADDGLENLIGRYGALVLAVLTSVMGAGALVSWAISHGLLGPWVRVALGALLALAIAGTGWWLRTRGSRDFGNVLIALSLAVVNVV